MRTLEGTHDILGWRWLFIVEGAATAGIALFVPFFLLDYPSTPSKKFTEAERSLAVRRIAADGITDQAVDLGFDKSLFKMLWSAVKNWRIYFVAVPYMQLVGASALSYFFPTLVQGLGYTSDTAQ